MGSKDVVRPLDLLILLPHNGRLLGFRGGLCDEEFSTSLGQMNRHVGLDYGT
jgi:hypothetical protein